MYGSYGNAADVSPLIGIFLIVMLSCSSSGHGESGTPFEETAFEMEFGVGAFSFIQTAECQSVEGVEGDVEVFAYFGEAG